jgi:hypothetical protein
MIGALDLSLAERERKKMKERKEKTGLARSVTNWYTIIRHLVYIY